MHILLTDDHALFREGVALLLQPLIAGGQTWQAGSCDEALALLDERGAADLALMDLAMPGTPGLKGIAVLRERWPQMPVVALSSADDRDTVLQAIDAGAMGFVPKSSSSAVLMAALQLILAHGIYLPPTAFIGTGAAVDARPERTEPSAPSRPPTPASLGLSPRQSDVLHLILQGKPAKLIERELGLSASTVKAHTSAVLRALNVTTRTQAVVAAGRLGLRF
jgi:DNA-binding NarL/FixJ family response regulator